ncbi:lebercilin-like isoform X1 [Lytechinus pictus]|uniref:lebercilin-like isoform X1 n=1 Tax=Lytechinus pictus TaxID=7653 RepID=UPI0030BA0D19
MTSNAIDSFFDSDGDREEPFTLKGEYHRGVTPPTQFSNSPHDDKPDSGSRKTGKASPHHSRSSTSGNFTGESDTMSNKRDSSGSYHDRSRSRSRSPSASYRRSRSRTPDYSDSFDSEDSMQDSRKASPARNKKSTRRTTANAPTSRYSSGTSKDSRSTYRSYGSSYTARTTKPSVKKGAPKKKGAGRSQSVTGLQQSPRSTEVTRRMLSAKGHTINKLRSDFDDLRRKYDDAIRENKLMKQLQRRQEAALAKFEDKDEELPQLLRSHAAEVDNLRERLRRTQDREKDKDRRLKDKNEELNRLNDEVKKLRHLAENNHLLDRDKLQRKVDKLHDNLDEKERRVTELEKHIENVKKNVKHDSEQWKQREREYRARVSYLEDENQTIKFQLKEKEKELEIRNIYSNRVMKPPAKLNATFDSSPRPLAQTRATSNDDIKNSKPKPTIKRSSSAEEKRKVDHTPRAPEPEVKQEEKKVSPRKEKKKEKELSEHEKILMDLDGGFKPAPPKAGKDDDVLKDLDIEIKKRERQEEEKRRAEERRKREKEEEEKRRKDEEKERRRRIEQEEEERKKKEEEERKGQLSFFSGPKNPYQSSKTKAKTSAFEPYFPSNKIKSNANTSKAPGSNSSNETGSYKPSFANSSKPRVIDPPKETDSYKPSFLPSTSTSSNREEVAKKEFGGGGRLGRQEEKKPFWLRTDERKDSPRRTRDISLERERKQKEEALVKSSTFITKDNPSAPKTPIFDDASSDEEDNIPFFGSKPKNAPPSKPKGAPPSKPNNAMAAVNSVRDLHKYSSNVRQNSGSSKPDSRESGDNNERKREEEDLASQRKKQKEESERLAEERRKKDLLLAKMKEIDNKPESRGSKKEYKFTQPIENLHNGKPSHPDLLGSPQSTPKKKPAADSDTSFGGYAPSFGRRAAAGDKSPIKKGGLFEDDDDDSDDIFATPKPKQADKSKDLRSNFFSDNKSTTPNKGRNSFEGSIFSTSTKAKPVADSTTLPWEKKTQQGSLFNQSNKPNGLTVNVPKSSFDDFDDDIEEVIL